MSDHYCCKICGLRYDDCRCGKSSSKKSKKEERAKKSSILPCPFCGSEIQEEDVYPTGTGWRLRESELKEYVSFREVPREQWCYSVNCLPCNGGCGAEMHADTKEEAIENWNKRIK